MSRSGRLILFPMLLALAGVALAAPADEGTVNARLRALEKRLSDLEQKQSESPSAALERRVSALELKMNGVADTPTAVPRQDTSLEQRVSRLEDKGTMAPPAAAPAPAAPVGPPRWHKHANWTSLKIGMTWSQVKATLGVPGKVQAGVFGDVMYFPDANGGKVEFDRDGRVSAWSETGKDD